MRSPAFEQKRANKVRPYKMAIRIATSMALIVFSVCLLIGGLQAGNPFTTTVMRAIFAMIGTLIIGLVVGAMAQRMLDDNVKNEAEKLKENEADNGATDR